MADGRGPGEGRKKMSHSLQEMQKSLKNEIIITDISLRFLVAIQRFALLFQYRPFTCSWKLCMYHYPIFSFPLWGFLTSYEMPNTSYKHCAQQRDSLIIPLELLTLFLILHYWDMVTSEFICLGYISVFLQYHEKPWIEIHKITWHILLCCFSEKFYHVILVICHFLSISANFKAFNIKLHMREYSVISIEASAAS